MDPISGGYGGRLEEKDGKFESVAENDYELPAGTPKAVEDELEKRAKPEQKARFQKMVGAADVTRLSANQFSYSPGKLTTMLAQTFLPTDAIVEHFRAATTTNAYASGANWGSWSGRIAGLQAAIEFIRNIIRVIGDVIGAASAVLGGAAIVLAGLSLIPGLGAATGPLAAAAAVGGETLALVKAGLDIQDAVIGIIQSALSIIRAWTAKGDPAERARIAQLLKKESGEISSSLMNGVVSVATIGVGNKVFGKLGGKAATEGLEAAAKTSVRQFPYTKIARAGLGVKMAPTIWAAMEHKAAQMGRNVIQRALASARYNFKWRFDALRNLAKELKLPGRFDKGPMTYRLALVGDDVSAISWAFGSGVQTGAAKGKIEVGNQGADGTPYSGSSGPGKSERVPDPVHGGLTFRETDYWPSALKQFGSTRGDIQNASTRMKDQYKNAKDDAGDKGAAYEKIKGTIVKFGTRTYAAGAAGQTAAAEGAAGAKDAKVKTKTAGEKQDEANKKGKEAEGKGDKAKSEADSAQSAGKNAKAGDSWLDTAKKWLWDKTLGKLFGYLAKFQKWLGDLMLKGALKLAGITPEELDLAGIERSAAGEEEKDKKAEADSKETQAKAPVIDTKLEQLKGTATDQEKGAIQGMDDARNWIIQLDDWDQTFAMEQDMGSGYIAAAVKAISHETGIKSKDVNEGRIDAKFIAPLVEGGDSIKQFVGGLPEHIKGTGTFEAGLLADRIDAVAAGKSGPARAKGIEMAEAGAKASEDMFSAVGPEVDKIVARGQATLNTVDYQEVDEANAALELLWQRINVDYNKIMAALDAKLQQIADVYMKAIAEEAKGQKNGAPPPPPETPGTPATHGGPGAVAPPPADKK